MAKKEDGRVAWFTWETQRRNKELSRAFGARYCHHDYSNRSSLVRYFLSAWFTLKDLFTGSYKIVFAQCPSLLLVGLLALFRRVKRFTFVVDAHNASFEYLESQNFFVRSVMAFSFRSADFVLISNSQLAGKLSDYSTASVVLPDKLPVMDGGDVPDAFMALKRPLVVLVATFAEDEPIETFLDASKEYAGRFSLLVTGRKNRAGELLRYQSASVSFTDFLCSSDFDALVQGADLIVDLTTRDDCLVCGAYEAVAAEVPALLSDSEATSSLFSQGCIYAKNSVSDYNAALADFIERQAELKDSMEQFKRLFQDAWQEKFCEARRIMWEGAGIPTPPY